MVAVCQDFCRPLRDLDGLLDAKPTAKAVGYFQEKLEWTGGGDGRKVGRVTGISGGERREKGGEWKHLLKIVVGCSLRQY